jgi:hypothetical protein
MSKKERKKKKKKNYKKMTHSLTIYERRGREKGFWAMAGKGCYLKMKIC